MGFRPLPFVSFAARFYPSTRTSRPAKFFNSVQLLCAWFYLCGLSRSRLKRILSQGIVKYCRARTHTLISVDDIMTAFTAGVFTPSDAPARVTYFRYRTAALISHYLAV